MTSTDTLVNHHWKNEQNHKNAHDDSKDTCLSEFARKVARKELREDKMAREQCLENLRNWLRQNGDVENVRTDDSFLLRFLRVNKFSITMAQQTILKYLNLKKTFPRMFLKLDYLDPKMEALINNGYYIPSPIRDKNGRRVIIGFASKFDTKVHTSEDMTRVHMLTYETLLEDQETQVLGIVHIGDFNGLTTSHVTAWNPTEFSKMMKWGEQSIPMRHKAVHLVNLPTSIKWLLESVKTIVTPKMKERFFVTSGLKDLHKHVDPACLPIELGGKIPMSDMIASWKCELAAKRNILLRSDEMKLLSDRGIASRRGDKMNNNGMPNFASQMESISGSFRKLEID